MIIECLLIASSLCRTLRDKPVMGMFVADVTVKTLDVRQTESHYRWGLAHPCSTAAYGQRCGFIELDPIAGPLVPHPAAYYVAAISYGVGSAWLADKLRHSRSQWIRHLWWAPQLFGVGSNLYGYVKSYRRLR